MMDDAKVYQGLSEIFQDVFMGEEIPLHADLSAKDIDGWDSFKHIEIIMATEERFAVKFTSAELDNLVKLGDLVKIVVARGKSRT